MRYNYIQFDVDDAMSDASSDGSNYDSDASMETLDAGEEETMDFELTPNMAMVYID
jgi:hypothetical protein